MDRETVLRSARDRWEAPFWALIEELERTLADLSRVRNFDPSDSRAVGSVLNSALADAADAAALNQHGLEVIYVRDGRSNKLVSSLRMDGFERSVSFELHLSGPRGGTSKTAHQFAGKDIDGEPSLPGFGLEAPDDLFFFIACHLGGTGSSVARAFIKFADGIDQRMVEIHRALPAMAGGVVEPAPLDGPAGSKLTLKRATGEEGENGSQHDQRRDAASRSK